MTGLTQAELRLILSALDTKKALAEVGIAYAARGESGPHALALRTAEYVDTDRLMTKIAAEVESVTP